MAAAEASARPFTSMVSGVGFIRYIVFALVVQGFELTPRVDEEPSARGALFILDQEVPSQPCILVGLAENDSHRLVEPQTRRRFACNFLPLDPLGIGFL